MHAVTFGVPYNYQLYAFMSNCQCDITSGVIVFSFSIIHGYSPGVVHTSRVGLVTVTPAGEVITISTFPAGGSGELPSGTSGDVTFPSSSGVS